MPTPNAKLPTAPNGSSNISLAYNQAMQIIDALLPLVFQTMTLSAPPATVEADSGKRWLVGSSPTGAWAGAAGKIALCVGAGQWTIIDPPNYIEAWVVDLSAKYRNVGGAWTAV